MAYCKKSASVKMTFSIMIVMTILSCVSGLVTLHSPSRLADLISCGRRSSIQSSFTKLNAEKPTAIDRSASVCVSEFFSSSGKLPMPSPDSRLSAVRIAGAGALSNAKLPFGKDEAWR